MKTKAMTNAGWTPKKHQKYKIHQKYINSKTKKRKLSAIYFKAANVVPDGFLSAVPDGIGAKQSKFGDVPADHIPSKNKIKYLYRFKMAAK